MLSLIVFAPAVGALLLTLPIFPRENPNLIRLFTLAVTVLVLIFTIILAIPGFGGVLDIFDSILLLTPFGYLFSTFMWGA